MIRRLLQFFLGFIGAIFLFLIQKIIVNGQTNLSDSNLVPEGLKEWSEKAPLWWEWLNNIADENWVLAWVIVFLVFWILFYFVYKFIPQIWTDIKDILSSNKTIIKNLRYGLIILSLVLSFLLTFYLRIPNLTLTPNNATLYNADNQEFLYLGSKVDLKLSHNRKDKAQSELKYAVCYSKSYQPGFWKNLWFSLFGDNDFQEDKLNKDNDCAPAFVIEDRLFHQGNINGSYYWSFKAFENKKSDNKNTEQCQIGDFKKCKSFGYWSKPIRIAQYKDSLIRIRQTGKVLIGLSTSYNQGIYSLKIKNQKTGILERSGVDLKVAKEIVKQIKERTLDEIFEEIKKTNSNINELQKKITNNYKNDQTNQEIIKINQAIIEEIKRYPESQEKIKKIQEEIKPNINTSHKAQNPSETQKQLLQYTRKLKDLQEDLMRVEILKAVYVETPWTDLFDLPSQGKADFIISSISKDTNREEEYNLQSSDPYDIVPSVLVYRNNNKKNENNENNETIQEMIENKHHIGVQENVRIFLNFKKKLEKSNGLELLEILNRLQVKDKLQLSTAEQQILKSDGNSSDTNSSYNQKIKDIVEKFLAKIFKSSYKDPLALFQALIDGEVNYIIMDRPFAKYAQKHIFCEVKNDYEMLDLGEAKLTGELFQDIFPNKDAVALKEEYVVAVRQHDQRLMDIINPMINNLKTQTDINPRKPKKEQKPEKIIEILKYNADQEAKKAALSASGELDACKNNT
jgi:ABC-type amino acid transport substrate-binding protein